MGMSKYDIFMLMMSKIDHPGRHQAATLRQTTGHKRPAPGAMSAETTGMSAPVEPSVMRRRVGIAPTALSVSATGE